MAEVKKKSGDILMTAKAYNGRCILEFLAFELENAIASGTYPNNQRLALAAVCMCLA